MTEPVPVPVPVVAPPSPPAGCAIDGWGTDDWGTDDWGTEGGGTGGRPTGGTPGTGGSGCCPASAGSDIESRYGAAGGSPGGFVVGVVSAAEPSGADGSRP